MSPNDPKMSSNEPVKNKRNELKSGDPNEDNIHGRDLIEQAFSSNQMAEVIEIIKTIRIYKTKYHKPLKNKIKNRLQQDLKMVKML